ncbi:MAG: DUF1080 domain-containing protein [Isosphaeraceae bacterium]
MFGRLVLLAIATISPARARPDGPTTPKPLVLFDGKTLDGWKRTGFLDAGVVKVDDGAIVMAPGGSMTGITSTRNDLFTTNYELTYEARRLEGRDFFAAATFPVGKSFLTFVNGGWGGTVTGLSSLDGADASENETQTAVDYKTGIWHRFKIHVSGKAIRCWVDDKLVVGVGIEGRHLATRVESRRSEPLGFATWETGGAVRKILMRPLSAAEVAANDREADDDNR